MKEMEDFNSVRYGAIENQVILKSLDAEGPQLTQPLMREMPDTSHARHPRQFLKRAVGRFHETISGLNVVKGDVFPNRIQFRLDKLREDEFRHSGGVY